MWGSQLSAKNCPHGLCPSWPVIVGSGEPCALLPCGFNKGMGNLSSGACRGVMGGERLSFHCEDFPVVGWAGRCPKVRHQHSIGFCCIQRKRLPYGRQTYLEVALRPRLKYQQNKDTRARMVCAGLE